MGGTHSAICNDITRDLLLWCKSKQIWVSACHIAGIDNSVADKFSRIMSVHTEWKLDSHVFKSLCSIYGQPEIDLFASRSNHQLKRYMSRYPDPHACAIDAFYHKWEGYVYIFAPFILIHRVLRKLKEDRTDKALVIVPDWRAQIWYPKLQSMIREPPHFIKTSKTLLSLPSDVQAVHPLYPKLQLVACVLSGKD